MLSQEERTTVRRLLYSVIKENGALPLYQITQTLSRKDMTKEVYHGLGPKKWIKRYFPEFKVTGEAPHEELILNTKEEDAPRYFREEFIPAQQIAARLQADLSDDALRLGVIDKGNSNRCFINGGLGEAYDPEANPGVIVNQKNVATDPEGLVFDPAKKIYLVLYAVSGAVANTKTGVLHPAIDYSVPVRVLREEENSKVCSVSISAEGIRLVLVEGRDAPMLDPDRLAALRANLEGRLVEGQFVLGAQFPSIASEAGIEDYRVYAETVGLFLEYFLPEYTIRETLPIGKKTYPNVIVRKESVPSHDNGAAPDPDETPAEDGAKTVPAAPDSNEAPAEDGAKTVPAAPDSNEAPAQDGEKTVPVTSDVIEPPAPLDLADASDAAASPSDRARGFETFLALVAAGRYADALSCTEFRTCPPHRLPLPILEAALTAAERLLFPEHSPEIRLNLFQKEVFYAASNMDFIRKWKSAGMFPEKLMTDCADSCVAAFDFPIESQGIARLINAVGRQLTLGNNYAGLCLRFAACSNRLLPHLYLLRAFVLPSTTSVVKILQEYSRYVREIRRGEVGAKLSDAQRISGFDRLLQVISDCVFSLAGIPAPVRVSAARVFVEYGMPETAGRVISLWDPAHTSPEWGAVSLATDFRETSPEEARRLAEECEQQLLLRCIALRWGGIDLKDGLPPDFLQLLAVFMTVRTSSALEDVLRYPSGKNSKLASKQKILCRSLERICSLSASDERMYLLASFVAYVLFPEYEKMTEDETVRAALAAWPAFAAAFYDRRIAGLLPLSDETQERILQLFPLFQLDTERYLRLQMEYGRWVLLQHGGEPFSEEDLGRLYDRQAYAAFCLAFVDAAPETVRSQGLSEKYVLSLVHLRDYTQAVSFLCGTAHLSVSEKARLLALTLSENFREYGLSHKAFACFGDDIQCEDVVRLLETNLPSSDTKSVNALTALYLRQKEYVKAAYLFCLYSFKAESGYARLYRHFRAAFGQYINLGKIKSHYSVVDCAFQVLDAERLVDFLAWAGEVHIPDSEEHREAHVFRYSFDLLLSRARSRETWSAFLEHLEKNGPGRNAWYICVCETVLRRVFGGKPQTQLCPAFNAVLKGRELNPPAPAFPVYAFADIMDTGADEVCRLLLDAFSDRDLRRQLVDDNVWMEVYRAETEAFTRCCIERAHADGSELYRDVLFALGLKLSVGDLFRLSENAVSKQRLLLQLSRSYLENSEQEEARKLLFSADWGSLPAAEAEFLSLLRLIYDDDVSLLEEPLGLFADEEEVRRFKQDCALILADYPEKKALFAFEESCVNTDYKALVYAYVFRVLYDHDLYKGMDRRFVDFKDERCLRIYLTLLCTCYRMQLGINTSFFDFYQRWRYLKLYLANVLLDPDFPDDGEIVSLMRENGHYDAFYLTYYAPFVQLVRAVTAIPSADPGFLRHFLYTALVGNSTDFFPEHAAALAGLPAQDRKKCRDLVACLDYRECCRSLYVYLQPWLETGDFAYCLGVADGVSAYACDAINAFAHAAPGNNVFRYLPLMLTEKPSQVLKTVIGFGEKQFAENCALISPILCSRQFLFYINDRFRTLVIQHKDEALCRKYDLLAAYLVGAGDRNAATIACYLRALCFCQTQRPQEALAVLNKAPDLLNAVPATWEKEARSMLAFAGGKLAVFKPDHMIQDSSQENRRAPLDLSFAARILKAGYDRERLPDTEAEALSVYDDYLNAADPEQKTALGLTLLAWMAKGPSRDKKKLPSPAALALEVGLSALAPDAGLSPELKLACADAILRSREAVEHIRNGAPFEELKQKMTALIGGGFPLRVWTASADEIGNILKATQAELDFPKLRKQILEKCGPLFSSETSYDEKEDICRELLGSFAGLTSAYAISVRKALEKEQAHIGDGIRLSVKIENESITDAKIYFCISNTGERSVNFAEDGVSVWLKQAPQPDAEVQVASIRELQKGWMTGAVAPVILSPGETGASVQICVYRALKNGGRELVCRSEGKELPLALDAAMYVPEGAKYDTGAAVTEENLLFGRDDRKQLLKTNIPKGVTLIYGPSRIGKTSLMNWVRNSLAPAQGNVITLQFGGEGGIGKDSDYRWNFMDRTQSTPVPYGSDYEMSQYLLVDTILFGLTNTDRLGEPAAAAVPEGLYDTIKMILRDPETGIKSKYKEISRRLAAAGLELWLLLDEFQQVVEQWTPDISCEFIEVCNLLMSAERNKPANIKLVVCGSDDLLRHMVLAHNSVWKKAFRHTVPVEALKEEFFLPMIEQDPALRDANIRFSPMATHALFVYTGGVALYGKEICNAILEDVRSNPDKRACRTCIYTADVSEATQELLDRQSADLSTSSREGISEIYAAVTHNLGETTDKQMLWYMAKWLYHHPHNDGFPESVFTGAQLTKAFGKAVGDSIRIAEARGILRHDPSRITNETVYRFTTLFYYYAFYGSAKDDNLKEELIFAQPEQDMPAEELVSSRILRDYLSLPPKKRDKTLGELWRSEEDDKVRRRFEKDFFRPQTQINTGGGNVVEGNLIQMSIQNMTNSFHTLLTGDAGSAAFLQAFDDIPTLSQFIEEERRPALTQQIERLHAGGSAEEARAAADAIEAETLPAEQRYFGAVVAAAMSTPDFYAATDERWRALIHTDRAEMENCLRPEIFSALSFAVMLHQVFDSIRMRAAENDDARRKVEEKLDYCPVALMYCKVVEAMLRELHTPIYVSRLPQATLRTANGRTFGDLLRADGSINTESKELSIGSYAYHIVEPEAELFRKIRDGASAARVHAEAIRAITGLQGYHEKNEAWETHARNLAVILSIRNTSAHEASPISREELDLLICTLFDRRELMRITRLANWHYPCAG